MFFEPEREDDQPQARDRGTSAPSRDTMLWQLPPDGHTTRPKESRSHARVNGRARRRADEHRDSVTAPQIASSSLSRTIGQKPRQVFRNDAGAALSRANLRWCSASLRQCLPAPEPSRPAKAWRYDLNSTGPGRWGARTEAGRTSAAAADGT